MTNSPIHHTASSFLHLVASSLLSKFGSNLSRVTVVFPGQRASLFLNQALAEISPTPVWTPRYVSIRELFQQASPYTLCDTVESVCRLYRSYCRHVPEPQPLDQFYGWGEVLLSDFDDVDKHLVDVRQLFTNIRDLKALDDNSYITPEQEEALRSFFSNFSLESNSALKERFLQLWNNMLAIYEDLNASMKADGVLYEGALQRDVVKERLSSLPRKGEKTATSDRWSAHTFIFVGFNVLNNVEQALFDALQERDQALFYWDYDLFYANPRGKEFHEAGHFIRQNLQRYGNELPSDCFDNLRKPKVIDYISVSSENAQARYLPHWLHEHLTRPENTPKGERTWRENQTAVVLCNEQLLQPVLHSLGSLSDNTAPSVEHREGRSSINVTMGFPLTDTPVMSFVTALVNLQTDGYERSHGRFRSSALRAVSSHPFASFVPETVWKCFSGTGPNLLLWLLEVLAYLGRHFASTPEGNADNSLQLYAEAVFQTYTSVNRLRDLMSGEAPLLQVNEATLRRLLFNILRTKTIPFHGEPAVGLQVMGVLETRSLDFRHLIMLSVGEGFLPKTLSDNSFIPYHLKEAFGLTTIRHKIAVYAYYFYRLIQRAEHITFVYNESNAGTRQNEISRFLRQLLAETDFPIRRFRLQAESCVSVAAPIVIPKTPELMSKLLEGYDNTGRHAEQRRFLSPSAMNSYTTCPLKFYYRYVQGMRIDPDPKDGLDAILFGNVFHKAAELLYKELTSRGCLIQARDIEAFLEKGGLRLDSFVRQAFREEFFQQRPEEYTGILLIAVRVLHTYLEQLLQHDLRLTPFCVLGQEVQRTTTLRIPLADRVIEIDTGGIIDRLDQVHDELVEGGTALRVVDYKTGGLPQSVASIEKLFQETGQREHYYFQTMLYASIVAEQEQQPVTPCLFFVHKSGAPDYSPKLKLQRQQVNDIRDWDLDFRERLRTLVAEIFNADIPFTQTAKTEACQHCDFRKLCER